jgi:hypothetical protein
LHGLGGGGARGGGGGGGRGGASASVVISSTLGVLGGKLVFFCQPEELILFWFNMVTSRVRAEFHKREIHTYTFCKSY